MTEFGKLAKFGRIICLICQLSVSFKIKPLNPLNLGFKNVTMLGTPSYHHNLQWKSRLKIFTIFPSPSLYVTKSMHIVTLWKFRMNRLTAVLDTETQMQWCSRQNHHIFYQHILPNPFHTTFSQEMLQIIPKQSCIEEWFC